MIERPPSPPDADGLEKFIEKLCHFEIEAYACIPALPADLLLVAMAAMEDLHSLCKRQVTFAGQRSLDARLRHIDDMERIAALTGRRAWTREQIKAAEDQCQLAADMIALERAEELEELLRLPEEHQENNS